jgi:gluconolactonase
METLTFGYGLLEGPRPDADGGIYFSDVTRGGVYRLAPDGTVEVVVPKRKGVGGIALHADGGVVISGRDICHVRDGETRVLFGQEEVAGYNDLFTDAEGCVYTGSLRESPFHVEGDRAKGEMYRIEAEGQARELYDGVGLSNGIGISPDGRFLYHADSTDEVLIVHELDGGAVVPGSRRAIEVAGGTPDGLAVDEDGGIWLAVVGPGLVRRYTPDGRVDREIDMPAGMVTSLVFAGPDRRDLIVVTADNTEEPERRGTIFRLPAAEVGAVGVPAPLARV